MTETITEAQQWELGSLVVCLVISQKLSTTSDVIVKSPHSYTN